MFFGRKEDKFVYMFNIVNTNNSIPLVSLKQKLCENLDYDNAINHCRNESNQNKCYGTDV